MGMLPIETLLFSEKYQNIIPFGATSGQLVAKTSHSEVPWLEMVVLYCK